MSPRKKLKSSHPQAPSDNAASGPLQENPTPATATSVSDTPSSTPNVSSVSVASSEQSKGGDKASRKWLGGGGSWRSKAPAVVTTRKESIGSNRGTTSELQDEDAKKIIAEDSPKKFLSKRKSSKGDALPASMTKLSVTSDGSVDQDHNPKPIDVPQEGLEASASSPLLNVDEPPLPPEPARKEVTNAQASTFGWRSWWSRPDGYAGSVKGKDGGIPAGTEDAQKTPLPGATPSEESAPGAKELGNAATVPHDVQTSAQVSRQEAGLQNPPESTDTEGKGASPDNDLASKPVQGTSWFWLWSSTQNSQTNPVDPKSLLKENETSTESTVAEIQSESQPTVPMEASTQTPPPPETTGSVPKSAPKPSGWAFWSKERPNNETDLTEAGQHKQVGEVAVFNTPSQDRPEVAQFNEQEETTEPAKDPPKSTKEEPVAKRSFMSLRGRPKKKDAVNDASKEIPNDLPTNTPKDTPSSSQIVTPSATTPSQSPARLGTVPAAQQAHKQVTKTKMEPPNIILPEFNNTYQLVQKPTYWQQIRRYFLGGERAQPHLHVNPAPPRIKKALAIGVHGYFPAPILQKVLGQPTGTSIRFANAARNAIEDWTRTHGYSTEIEQIALEGEGFIAERVNTLWKLLLNWIDHIKSADFILVACHSQGVPVAIMLIAKLIQLGCVPACRIGICAMAGVNMGPFIDYKTKYLGATAAELFEFGNPKSLVSQMYLGALDEILRHGVRILYVGSIDDQLVSLESSTFSTLSHPYIYRAVFVDGRIHAPDFLTHLVGFALKLRNLGLPDHGLIRELSPALAGSLYGGEGHSRVYEDPRVYELAVQHALETTSLPINPQQQRPSTASSFTGLKIPIPGAKIDDTDIYALRVKEYETVGAGTQNPFYLPWAMRGLLEEDFVKKELGQEVEKLLNMFEHWQPTAKQLKDVKFRLEGVRSRL